MTPCPSPEQFQSMLDEQMGDAEAAAIESHVQGCAACQQALERLTASRDSGTQGPLDRARRKECEPSAGESQPASTLIFRPHAAPADEQFGRYADVRFHAKGGLGEVFIGTDPELHRTVAIKRVRQSDAQSDALDPDRDRRFLVEAEVTARLEHPGVVPVHELLRDPHGRPCYAMRFVVGETLSHAIDRYHSSPGMRADRETFSSASCSSALSPSATQSPTPTAAASFTAT